MKTTFITLVAAIVLAATAATTYIATLPNPTEAQTNLANAANTIAIAGTTAIFGMLDDEDNGDEDKTQDKHEDS